MENAIIGDLPFNGNWITTGTPDQKIPSHGTFDFGVGYIYDFLKVGDRRQVS